VKATYIGQEVLTYLSNFDVSTGKTLVAEPGKTYDVTPFIPTDGRWVPVEEILPINRRGVAKQDASTPEVKE
jgi:hypothetical protein